MEYDLYPPQIMEKIHADVVMKKKIPGRSKELNIELNAAPAIRFTYSTPGLRDKPVADIEEGHISTASCIF
jgi:hypothetical protein